MSDSDDYGDDFNDTEILNVATQAERENTPAFHASPRPTKRRKFGHGNERVGTRSNNKQLINKRRPFATSDEDEADEGTDNTLSEDSVDESPNRRNRSQLRQTDHDAVHEGDESPVRETAAQKRRNRIHVPTTNLELTDVFFTQPPQEDSPPWKPRGAIWAKQTTAIGVHRPSEPIKWAGLDATKTMSLPARQSISSRPQPPMSPAKSPLPIDIADSPALPDRSRPVEYDFTQDLADLPSDAFASSSSSPQKPNGDNVVDYAQKRVVAPTVGLRQTTLFGRHDLNGEIPASQVNKRYSFIVDQKQEPPTHHKLDSEAIKTWVYPTNLGTIRDYQFNIVQRGLFHNLLVALPTGLGKTFIAATIMLNWYRWTTEAQIVFVAPTKPLVSQQVEACFGIAGIPRSDTTMLTGGVTTGVRSEEWKCKRVFFMTPQTFLNDLKHGYADPKKIVLLVVDEAHRATGAYAYVEVVSFLRRFNESFRVLALTATPGADIEAVQKVIDGLDISRVEIRTEKSMDICRYVHQKKIEKHVFQNSDEMEMCMELYSQALQPLVSKVAGLNAYWSSNPLDLTPFGCQQAKKKYFLDAGRNASQPVKAIVNAIFTILGSISHAMDLLKFHGMGPFYIKLKDFRDESEKTKSKYKKQILDSDAFKKLMVRLQSWLGNDNFVGHPKLDFLQQVILDHFVNAGNGQNADGAPPSETRIMVFAHFRDSAEEISRILKRHNPMIRPRVFLGQASGKNSEGMSQKEQLEVIQKFKDGEYNTLIATSIGEEGLDIGEVDLIILYDSKASPIRMLQRMGRTGRKRDGKIVMLQMQGKEENDAIKAKDSYEKMQEIIANGTQFNFHDEISRKILPPDVKPIVDRRVVEIPLENSQQDFLPEPRKRGRTKKPPKVFHMPDGVRTGFVKAGRMDEEIVPKSRTKKAVAPVYPSEKSFDIPPLESVLLDEDATKDLARRFSTVFDEDALMVSDLDVGRHYKCQRTLASPQLLSAPGRAARGFVDIMCRMNEMDTDRLATFKRNLHYSDCESESENNILISDTESRPEIHEDMWADEDEDILPPPKKAKAKTKPEAKANTEVKVKSKPGPKAKATTTPNKPRGRPRKDAVAIDTPARPAENEENTTPRTKTPNWRTSGLAQEGEESSPPPTDPRFHIASQADTIGSDDTVGEFEIQDPEAYKLDSELASFIVEDDEDVDIPTSSLPNIDLSGLGKSTQALVQAAKPKRAPRREKIFTSDPTDDDAIVSSDSEDNEPLVRSRPNANLKLAFVVDSASEGEDDAPIIPKKRARRVIEDDEDE